MADLRATYQILDYEPDRGDDIVPIAYRGNLVVPIGLTATQTETILNAGGAQLHKFNGVEINQLPKPPCPESNTFSPRKLVFFLLNGKSISFPIADRENALALATAGVALLETISSVVCVKLVGEEWINLMEIFGESGKLVTVSALDPRGATYAGLYEYESDATNPIGAQVRMKFRVDSEDANLPPQIIGNANWVAIVGDRITGQGFCPGKQRRVHRRYTATAMVDRGGITRGTKIEIPVESGDAADIRLAGETVAALPPVTCLKYNGESYDRFHNLL